MSSVKALAVLFVLAAPTAGLAADRPRVIDTKFVVWLAQKDGSETEHVTTIVPYLPGRACFGWSVLIENAPDFVALRETLQLPAPAGSWRAPGSTIAADGTAAKSDRVVTPIDGQIGVRWCLADGDPLGPHTIDISSEDWLDTTFAFEVVAP
ncbi:hypothetical protein [Pelagibacterium sp.]|uniref:hypothetical protein n=1 Tax=Pelagibacterium sp. TaxID=1967288 RepID=UPI003A90EFBC